MIRLRGLSKRYKDGAAALDGVDLDVAAGEFVTLIGPSGAGKSTLLRCINGLVLPTAGEITVDGQSVTGASPDVLRLVRARVGFIFQHFNLLKRLSVLDNVRVGTHARTSSDIISDSLRLAWVRRGENDGGNHRTTVGGRR